MIRNLVWTLINIITNRAALGADTQSKVTNQGKPIPIITASQPIWIKVKKIKHKPVGIMMGDSIAKGRILWLWCQKQKGKKQTKKIKMKQKLGTEIWTDDNIAPSPWLTEVSKYFEKENFCLTWGYQSPDSSEVIKSEKNLWVKIITSQSLKSFTVIDQELEDESKSVYKNLDEL